ncbi:HyaD/HybD family hydrogenase maturation endopeptidase [Phosphitispora fastidiosa]|uniref:HyaD/HybD family hydrogenase maturation endopeptidase n=1 Tax=Phosphitispora fastidiosa TaxID=2837202 RepID=UPI001E48F89B|nr:HyaD/HybD family hydrogenase maturation endopeptidase [Phosphitispora fastidiosa]MBU7006661.1 hydrogenase maturation protease [Phosphitispora fastidiosa]
MNRVTVMGVGNDLLRDEGIGVHVIKAMEGQQLPDGVKIVNGWVAGIDLLQEIQNTERLIIVDAIDTGDRPGTIYRFRADEVDVMINRHKTSLHQVDLFETLKLAKFLGGYPETVIIGIQPRDIVWGTELSPLLASLIPQIVDVVRDEIRTFRS